MPLALQPRRIALTIEALDELIFTRCRYSILDTETLINFARRIFLRLNSPVFISKKAFYDKYGELEFATSPANIIKGCWDCFYFIEDCTHADYENELNAIISADSIDPDNLIFCCNRVKEIAELSKHFSIEDIFSPRELSIKYDI